MHHQDKFKSDKNGRLENYKFSGLEASLAGAVKSVGDYYRLGVTAQWVYGMTGLAFLHVVDEGMVEPNGGPPDREVLALARNIGMAIEGFDAYAEGEEFKRLQAEAWESAKRAIKAGQPVFAKNIDIGNQTSVVHAYDEEGYYTRNWHTGFEHSEEVIPWHHLGLSRCPCVNCAEARQKEGERAEPARGLISLHWAAPVEAADDRTALKEALAFAIRLNEGGTYRSGEKTYFVGDKAYDRWLAALEHDELHRYFFGLFVEILYEERHHAAAFLREASERIEGVNAPLTAEAVQAYTEIAAKYATLKRMYPYEEPPVREMNDKARCAAILEELRSLEGKALFLLKEIHAGLG